MNFKPFNPHKEIENSNYFMNIENGWYKIYDKRCTLVFKTKNKWQAENFLAVH